jgi:V8-like Glu-specific endopeptidase
VDEDGSAVVLTTSALASEAWRADDAFEPLTFEKVVGLNNLLRIAWLSRGLELAAPVCRVLTPAGPASGFLIANDLLLTNHHVLPDAQTAGGSTAEFNYQVNWAGDLEPSRRYPLDSSHFLTSLDLDYSIVRVTDSPGDLYGFIDLSKRGNPTVNDFVTIIQHPQGGTKQICFTDNKVSAVFGNLLQYATDTEPGSSGSPVFDQQWQIVGLHHRGGGLAGPDGKKYFTNEGILIAAVLRDAATFLGLPDALYDFTFGDLRSQLVALVNETQPPTDVDALTTELLRTLPRFSTVLDDTSKLNGSPGDSPSLTLAVTGVAIGGALRQWARSDGHESIKTVATPASPPTDVLVRLVSAYNGTNALPSEVYAAILEALNSDPTPVHAIVTAAGSGGLAAAARAFMRGVGVGAKAYDPSPSEAPAAGSAPTPAAQPVGATAPPVPDATPAADPAPSAR